MLSQQAPSAVIMIRPHKFRSNPETAADNAFQASDVGNSAALALNEFDRSVATLREAGVTVHVFDDDGALDTPDSVFPNNWISTHAGGHIAIFPMAAENRRRERRWDIVDFLKRAYRVQDVIDYSGLEHDDLALEGTGAMVLDHIGRVAYVARSNRADPVLLERFCTHFNFEPMAFDAYDAGGTAVYHTNVMMAIGTDYALIADGMITDQARRQEVMARLAEGGRDVVSLSHYQIADFAGNAIELMGTGGQRLLALSARALGTLTGLQRAVIEKSARLLPLEIPTIETAGGSVRCTMAGIHLSPRPKAKA
ncbi:MAG: arginine deiminase-related protein [Pseudomonadota bacterium]